MTAKPICPECGAVLPPDAMQGVCPRCLGQVILSLSRPSLAEAVVIEQLGDRIGPYRLVQLLGEGGGGLVYLAEQTEPIRRQVAVKVIKAGMDTQRVIARFEAERQALALMDHCNIAKVLEAGATASGRPYFVMELVRGSKITDYCDAHQLSTPERLGLFIQVCQAIQHAHQKGIIHRDIKPSNILVTLQDGVPIPKVIDFGIAKATEQRLTEKTLFTALERFVGTPAYMSPEQAELSGLDVDTRSDIYSLGVLLYELLVGRTPFDARDLLAQGLDALRHTIRETEPPRPSTRVAALRGDELTTTAQRRSLDAPRLISLLRGDLDLIVMKCLEKDRTRRYETASGLAADLQRHLALEPILAQPPSSVYRLRKAVRRHKLGFAAAGTAALALLLGTALASWQAVRATQARDAAVRAEALEAEQRQKAEHASARAIQTAEVLRLNVYAADMRAADIAVRQENLGQARQLLRDHLPKPGQPDLRGVEWRYLWQKAQGDEAIILEQGGGVLSVDVSPDGRLVGVMVWQEGPTGRIWDSVSRRVVHDFSLMKPPQAVRRLTFHPQRPLLAVHYEDRLSVWNTLTWTPVMEEAPEVPAQKVSVEGDLRGLALAFSGDGQVLVRWHKGGLEAWQVDGWKKIVRAGEIPLRYARWDRLVVNRDGSECIESSVLRRSLRCWSLRSMAMLWELPEVEKPHSLELSPDGRWLAVGTVLGRIRVWSLPERQELMAYSAHQAQVFAMAFSPDGKWLASCGADQDIRLWQSGTSSNVARFRGHAGTPFDVRFSADGRWLATASGDYTARLWRLAALTEQTNCFTVPKGHALDPDLTPGHSFRTYNSGERAFELHSITDGRLLRRTRLSDTNLLSSAAVVPVRGAYGLFGADTNGQLFFWDRDTGQLVRTNHVGRNPTVPLLLSESQRLACAAQETPNGTDMLVCDLPGDRVLVRFTNTSARVSIAAAFSRDDALFAHGEDDGYYSVWDLTRRREILRVKATKLTSGAAAFSPDGRLLVTGNNDHTVDVWDIATGQRVYPSMVGHLVGVGKIQFSPDGRTLFTFGTDRTFRMWHVATGREMVSPLPLSSHLLSAPMVSTMTPDGNWLLEAVDEDRLRWTRLPTLAEIDAAERAQAQP